MQQHEGLFRKEALRHVSSPDDLDQVISITNPVGWAVLAAFALIVTAIVAYAFLGRVPVTVPGQGAIIPAGGVAEVVSLTAGQVIELHASVGATVQAGQPLATLQTVSGPTTITAPTSGQLIELVATRFSAVPANGLVARIRPADAPLQGILYVPIDRGSSVRPGQKVQITPASQTGQSSGFLMGTVLAVGEVPVSQAQLQAVLGPIISRQVISGDAEPLRVDVSLDRRPDGSLVWSSGQAGDHLIRPGVAVTGLVELRSVPPVEVVIPALDRGTR
jgi:hypothetical protein